MWEALAITLPSFYFSSIGCGEILRDSEWKLCVQLTETFNFLVARWSSDEGTDDQPATTVKLPRLKMFLFSTSIILIGLLYGAIQGKPEPLPTFHLMMTDDNAFCMRTDIYL